MTNFSCFILSILLQYIVFIASSSRNVNTENNIIFKNIQSQDLQRTEESYRETEC